jgi:hypothetical protein
MEQEGMGRHYRVKKLKSHVDNADPSISLRALDMSFKLADDYPANRNMNLNANVEATKTFIDLSMYSNYPECNEIAPASCKEEKGLKLTD